MKKVLCLVMALLISMLTFTAFAENDASFSTEEAQTQTVAIEVIEETKENEEPQYILVVDKLAYTLLYPLYMQNERTMIDADTLASLIGVKAEVKEGLVTFTNGETTATLSLTAEGAVLNDGAVVLDAYAEQKEEVTFVPLRFVAESFGCTVGFSPVFSEEKVFLGAYVTVETNRPSNVDFSLMLPDNLSELALNIIDITKTITGISPEIRMVEADKYTDAVNAALIAGEKVMFIKNDATAKVDSHKQEDLIITFDGMLQEETREELKKDEELRSVIYGENGKIFALPIKLSDEILAFAVSKTTVDTAGAAYFVSSMSELIISLTNPAE